MTLIVALATRHYVLLASDRRISSREGPREDSDTKSVILDGEYAVGFAGIGRATHNSVIDPLTGRELRERIEHWMCRELANTDAETNLQALCEKAGPLCESLLYTGSHTFLAVGYRSGTIPEIVTISNAFDENWELGGKPLPGSAHNFYLRRTALRGREFLLQTAGFPVPQEARDRLHNELQALIRGRPRRPYEAIKPVLRAMLATSEVSDGSVGTTFIVTTIPVVAVPVPFGISVFPDQPVQDLYRRESLSTTWRRLIYEYLEQFYPAYIGKAGTTYGAVHKSGPSPRYVPGTEGYRGPA